MPRLLIRCAVTLVVGALTLSAPRVTVAQTEPQKKPAPAEKPAEKQAEKKATPAAPAASKHIMMTPSDLKWGPAPAGLPAGAEVAVLDGDPAKPGVPFAMRVKVPDGYSVQPHWHPTTENLVILGGTLMMGTGAKFDEASMHALPAGGYSKMPAKTNHYVRAKGETTFQIYGTGPFSITYVNPKDDPRKKTTP
jgi:quercetin dioxygenase-like cupin family protein